ANAIYRDLDEQDALYKLGALLSGLPQLSPADRLRYARAAVRALCRGRPLDEAQALLARELGQPTLVPNSELHFALTMEQTIRRIRGLPVPPEVREALFALYQKQSQPERRHAVMVDAGEWAILHDADEIVEALVELYVTDVPRGTRERTRAERLYQRM